MSYAICTCQKNQCDLNLAPLSLSRVHYAISVYTKARFAYVCYENENIGYNYHTSSVIIVVIPLNNIKQTHLMRSEIVMRAYQSQTKENSDYTKTLSYSKQCVELKRESDGRLQQILNIFKCFKNDYLCGERLRSRKNRPWAGLFIKVTSQGFND